MDVVVQFSRELLLACRLFGLVGSPAVSAVTTRWFMLTAEILSADAPVAFAHAGFSIVFVTAPARIEYSLSCCD